LGAAIVQRVDKRQGKKKKRPKETTPTRNKAGNQPPNTSRKKPEVYKNNTASANNSKTKCSNKTDLRLRQDFRFQKFRG
jgi:hypothetical protein